ncbi:sterol 3-beta-glucosyltransferase [Aspergillus unguis]
MPPFQGEAKQRAKRRISASRPSLSTSLLFSGLLPDRLKEDHGDSQLDYTAPPEDSKSRNGMQNTQQSVMSLIAAVGSRTESRAPLDDSSDSDEGTETKPGKSAEKSTAAKDTTSAAGNLNVPPTSEKRTGSKHRGRPHRRSISDHKLFQPFKSMLLDKEIEQNASPSLEPSSSGRLSSTTVIPRPRSATPRAAPIMSRMVEARARLDEEPDSPQSSDGRDESVSPQSQASPLSLRLMEMFEFTTPEKVVVEYPCSLVKSMSLQGYMYITEGHVCFYAFFPRESTVAMKTGWLHKLGQSKLKYSRYWFSLKGDVLSYYRDPSKLYFPHNQIDLRYGISASLTESKEKGQESRCFQVTTDQGQYDFRAESSVNAQEWVKSLQKVIFRAHNAESIKISFPIETLFDVEEGPMTNFGKPVRIRVLREDYALDEYYFTFPTSGLEAYDLLKGLVRETPTRSPQGLSPLPGMTSPTLSAQGQRANTSALSSAIDIEKSSRARQLDSSSSFVNSLDQVTESSAVLQSMSDTTESASQILNRSDVFQSPTIHTWQESESKGGRPGRRASDEAARSIAEHSVDGLSVPGERPEIQYVSNDDEPEHKNAYRNYSAAAFNDIVKAGSYPFQRAAGFAGYLKNRSKEVTNHVATESMGYLEKVSGMWAGGRRHYGVTDGLLPDDRALYPETAEESLRDGNRFRGHFALPPTEQLEAAFFAHMYRPFPISGKMYISQNKLCFRSLLPGTQTKMILPLHDIETVQKEKGFRFGWHGIVVIVRGHEELYFEFNKADARDDCAITLFSKLRTTQFLVESGVLPQKQEDESEAARLEHRMLQEARQDTSAEQDVRTQLGESSELQSIFDDPYASIVNFKPSEPLRITCLTIGSRGDVQPYIALCKGLLAEGHKPRIATHEEFGPWIRSHGIDFAKVDGDPAELMRLCVENGMFTYAFLREATAKFRGWIDDLLSSAWKACQNTDVLIESPSAMAGIHISEALRIPYFRGFTMPWSKTRAYPHAFAVPERSMGGSYNYITYVMFDTVFWQAISGQVNRWRMNELGLKATSLDKMQPNKVPFLYNFSPSVVPPPLDFPDWIRITGYWFLSSDPNYTPPAELMDFIQRARRDKKKLVYIGFGSIVVSDPAGLTQTVVESVQKADVRCVLCKGWSARLGDPESSKAEVPLPPEVFQIKSAPHDWLFAQMDAIVHHGGAGTTGASVRAGKPSIVKPFFGDQFFFGHRIENLGAGIFLKKINVGEFSRALWLATHDERLIFQAKRLGEKVRSEDGVATAIQAIYRDLEYARNMTQQRSSFSSTSFSPISSPRVTGDQSEGDIEDWTMVGDDELDMEFLKRTRDRAFSDVENLPDRLLSSSSNLAQPSR